uniref:C2 domain-containing protein n=1 Tax=Macrostomum lignano TaxID=282301 RepID=A0A1I8F5C4_9PLAT
RELVLEIERLKRRVGSAKKAPAGVESDRDYWKREAEQLSQMLKSPVLMAGRSAGSRGSSPSGGARMSRGGKLRSPESGPASRQQKRHGCSQRKDSNSRPQPKIQTHCDLNRKIQNSRPQAKDSNSRPQAKIRTLDIPHLISQDYSSDHGADYVGKRRRRQLRDDAAPGGRSPPTRDRADHQKRGRRLPDTDLSMRPTTCCRAAPREARTRRELQALLDKFERAHGRRFIGNVRALTHRAATQIAGRDAGRHQDELHRSRRRGSCRRQPAAKVSLALRRRARRQRHEGGPPWRHRCQELEEQAKQLHRALADRDDELRERERRREPGPAEPGVRPAAAAGRQLEADLAQAQDAAALLQVKSLRDEQAQLRAGINNLDYEKDSLEGALQERADRLRAAEEEAKAKEALTADLRAQLHHAEYQLGRAQDQLGNREQELRQVRKASETAQAELASERHRADCLQRDVARLQDDLQVVTRENASLQSEIQDTAQEREQFKSKAQDYLAEERADLLEQYRQLSSESDRFQADAHQLESEGSSLRLELAAKEADCKRLKERLEQAEADLRDCRHTASAYELQLSNLTRSVSDLEDSLRQQELERAETMKDLAALRDLCARPRVQQGQRCADRWKTSFQHEARPAQGAAALPSLTPRRALRLCSGASRREKKFQTQLEAQERQAELAMLRRALLELSDTKLEQLGRDLA